MARVANPMFPGEKTFRKLGGQKARIELVRAYVAEHAGHDDIVTLLPAPDEEPYDDTQPTELLDGHVYLLKLGKHYKIGRTESVPRRHRQVNLELPEKAVLIHKIATDDTSGIEAYWHSRFAAKRTNGEWFTLNAGDVRVFKRRKFM